ncbi:MAG: DinB family protein, partial [Anaerolineae bacterium]|nr:DinB family protein [Anaerolineae bacterium]
IPVTGNPNTPPAEMFDRWQANRSQLCAWIEGLSTTDWSRPATHPERGQTTFGKEVQMLIDHDAEHLVQIDVVRQGWEARRARSPIAVWSH